MRYTTLLKDCRVSLENVKMAEVGHFVYILFTKHTDLSKKHDWSMC